MSAPDLLLLKRMSNNISISESWSKKQCNITVMIDARSKTDRRIENDCKSFVAYSQETCLIESEKWVEVSLVSRTKRNGESMTAMRDVTRNKTIVYMKSLSDRDGLAKNIGPHEIINTCIFKHIEISSPHVPFFNWFYVHAIHTLRS